MLHFMLCPAWSTAAAAIAAPVRAELPRPEAVALSLPAFAVTRCLAVENADPDVGVEPAAPAPRGTPAIKQFLASLMLDLVQPVASIQSSNPYRRR